MINRRTVLQGGAVAAVLSGSPAPARTQAPSMITIPTSSGPIRGLVSDGIAAFRGVPYGAPTSRANRFRPPVPPQPWSLPRDVFEYGPACPQSDPDGTQL